MLIIKKKWSLDCCHCNNQIIFEKYNANNKVKEFRSFVVRHHKADYPQLAMIQIVSPGRAFPTTLKTVSSPDPLPHPPGLLLQWLRHRVGLLSSIPIYFRKGLMVLWSNSSLWLYTTTGNLCLPLPFSTMSCHLKSTFEYPNTTFVMGNEKPIDFRVQPQSILMLRDRDVAIGEDCHITLWWQKHPKKRRKIPCQVQVNGDIYS